MGGSVGVGPCDAIQGPSGWDFCATGEGGLVPQHPFPFPFSMRVGLPRMISLQLLRKSIPTCNRGKYNYSRTSQDDATSEAPVREPRSDSRRKGRLRHGTRRNVRVHPCGKTLPFRFGNVLKKRPATATKCASPYRLRADARCNGTSRAPPRSSSTRQRGRDRSHMSGPRCVPRCRTGVRRLLPQS